MTKPLSLNEIRARAAAFITEWRDVVGEERQEAQSFVRDLLQVYGINESRAALYEKRAVRASTGGDGYIDALVPGLLLIEMKSAGKDLGLAEIQALDYMNSLSDAELPRYVLTSDFKRFRLLDRLAEGDSRVLEISLEQLHQYADKLAFLAGYQTRSFGSKEQELASIKAAQIMAGLYEALEETGYSDHESSIFLVRTLFCLYADDSGIWERDLFTDFIEHRTSRDGSDLGAQLITLFQVLTQPTQNRAKTLDEITARFPYVNGGIFAEPISIPFFDSKMRNLLVDACAFDWREISPAIFGSLFQAVKSPEARRSLGEHYTTETNILKTIGPLFLDDLKERFKLAQHDVKGLKRLRAELAEIRVFDPACGSGNFLIVAYRELRQLELEILLRLQKLGDTSSVPTLYFERTDLAVQLEHIAGIEIEEWPAQIAKTAIRLTDHQANMAMELALGKAPETLPLDTVLIIHVGNALRLDWADVMPASNGLRIVGNPPFVGHITKTREQVADLKHVWGKQFDGYLDYVTAWFKKAADHLADHPGGRFAFVSTNSIAQGQPVPALFKPLFEAGWHIRFAHQTFAWTTEAPGAAAVHCVITGFTRDVDKKQPVLFTYAHPKAEPVEVPATNINGYLIDSENIFVEKRMKPLSTQLPEVRFGSMPNDAGNLIVEPKDYEQIISDPVASKYLRPFLMGKELIHNLPRWCLWMQEVEPRDIELSAALKDRIQKVKEARQKSSRAATVALANTPHLFGENHQPQTQYLGIPRVFSEHRKWATCALLEPEVIAGDKVYTCLDPDGFAFAIISSSMFITWQKAIGGRLKSDPSFSNTLVWNNLPLPPVEPELREQIIEAGKGVLAARELHPERSLAEHYNPLAMSKELLAAHAKLDRVVDRAFGADRPIHANEERLPILFARYAELTTFK